MMVCCIFPPLANTASSPARLNVLRGLAYGRMNWNVLEKGDIGEEKQPPKSLKILFFNHQNSDWVKKYMHVIDTDTVSALGLIKQVREQLLLANAFKYFSKVSKFTHNVIVNVANLPFRRQHFKDNFSVKYIIKEFTRYQTTY